MRNLAILLTGLTLGLTGCPTSTGGTDDTDHDHDTDTDTDTREPPTYVLEGTVSNADGAPVVDASVFLCNIQICYQQFTSDTGGYAFLSGDGAFAFKIDAEGYPIASSPLVSVEDGTTRIIDVTLPSFEQDIAMPTAAGEHQLASNFYVSFSASDIEVPDTSDETQAGGTWVAEADRMPIDESPAGTLAGLWYLGAYDAKAKNSDLPFRVTDATALGLADGDTVDVYVHSYKEFTTDAQASTQWLTAGTVTVANNEIVGSLPYLATVAIYKQ